MLVSLGPCCNDAMVCPRQSGARDEAAPLSCALTCALTLADTSSDTQLKTEAINQDALDEQAASMATPATA